MNKLVTGVVMAAVVAACVFVSGCFRKTESGKMVETLGESTALAIPATKAANVAKAVHELGGGDIAAGVINSYMRPYFAVALVYIALGGLVFMFGGRAAGLSMIGIGIAINTVGHISIRYSWVYLLATLPVGGLLAVVAYDRWKLLKGAEKLAISVQNAPHGQEVKDGIKEQGFDAEKLVRRLVDPIRKRLAKEGTL